MKFSQDETNSTINTIKKMKLLLLSESTNPIKRAKHANKILSFIESIFSSHGTAEVFVYLLEHGAATAWTLQVDLQIPESTAYRALKRLRRLGLIDAAIKLHRLHDVRGGPRPTVWMLLGADVETVPLAINRHNRALSPNYRMAEEIAQSLLETWLVPKRLSEYHYRDLVVDVRRATELKGRNLIEITNMVATSLRGMDIKVWR